MPVSNSAASTRRLSSYDAVLARAPGHAGALVNRGNTLLRLNQPVEAIASYDAALAAMPGHPQILTNRGHALAPARPAASKRWRISRPRSRPRRNLPKPISKPR